MSKIPNGDVVMPPMSCAQIKSIAEGALQVLAPEMLESPRPLDILHLVDFALPQVGVHVYPASELEIPNELGVTDPTGDVGDQINILLNFDQWRDLLSGGRRAHRARATTAHEIGHAILHVNHVRRRLRLVHALHRVEVRSIEAFRSAEWQAWALAGCLLMPPSMIRVLPDRSPAAVGEVFEVSERLAGLHLKRFSDFIGRPR